MESFKGLIIFCAYLVILAATMNASVEANSKHFEVGDRFGWQQPTTNVTSEFYTLWATTKRFHVGDSLSFEYKNDSVLVVEKWDYYHCNTDNPISSFNDGETVINLDRPGLFYFISGAQDHCKKGQKLLIQVMGLHQREDSPPPFANPPDVGFAPAPNSSSGFVATSASLTSVFVALIIIATVITLA